MLAVFPQFIRPESGTIAGQALVLGTIIAGTQMARGVGLLLMAVAAFTILEGWRQASR